MPAVITSISPLTELEAINIMLAAIGEAPLAPATDLATVTAADVVTAISTLRNISRSVQAEGWRFNTEMGVEIPPEDTVNWEDSSGDITVLNVFLLPASVLQWRQTLCNENAALDLVVRKSKVYEVTAEKVPVLYDRAKNRDGAEAARYPFLYLDLVTPQDFEDMPQTARDHITNRAARIFVQQVLGADGLRAFAVDDETITRRSLVRDQGIDEDVNMFHTAHAQGILGGRESGYNGAWFTVSRGPA